jgi:hypothetical protein
MTGLRRSKARLRSCKPRRLLLMDVVGEIIREFSEIEMTSTSATARDEATLKAPAA